MRVFVYARAVAPDQLITYLTVRALALLASRASPFGITVGARVGQRKRMEWCTFRTLQR